MSRVLLIAMACVLPSFVTTAHSQDGSGMFRRDRNVAVLERSRPEYESSGIRVGSVIYTPNLFAGLEVNDNIFATASNEINDTVFRFEPSVGARTTWSRHSISANLGVQRREYLDVSSESTTDYNARIDGIIDVQRGLSIGLGASYVQDTEPRTSAGGAGQTADPIRFDTTGAYLTASREAGRTRLSGSVGAEIIDYDDATLIGGGVADQDFRDQDIINLEGKAEFAISPDTAIFARVRNVSRDYEEPATGNTRDQDTITVDVGANFDLSALVRGEIGIGYLETDFSDPTAEKLDGLSVDASVSWFPSQLVTVTADAQRGVQPSAVAASPAYLSTGGGLTVDYDFRENLIFSASASLNKDEYEGIDREDDREEYKLGATYYLDRNVGFSLNFVNTKSDSSGMAAQSDYSVNTITLGIVFSR